MADYANTPLLANGATNAQYSTASMYGAMASTTMFRTTMTTDSTADQTLLLTVTTGASVTAEVEAIYAKLLAR